MTERTNAKGITGFLLYPPAGEPVFRVYESEDKTKFTDYEIHLYDVKITLHDGVLFKRSNGTHCLDYANEPGCPFEQ